VKGVIVIGVLCLLIFVGLIPSIIASLRGIETGIYRK